MSKISKTTPFTAQSKRVITNHNTRIVEYSSSIHAKGYT